MNQVAAINRPLDIDSVKPEGDSLFSPLDKRAPEIHIENLSCTFGAHRVLDSINLSIEGGEMVALIGSSGAGKSTLLRQIAGLISGDATSGPVRIGEKVIQVAGQPSRNIRSIRADIGFIFQQFNLVERLSLLTNVLVGHLAYMPLYRRLLRMFSHEQKLEAMKALDEVGLAEFAAQRAGTLSGGQQQRAAIARAMVQGAKTILADEPIASLDPESARLVMNSLRDLNLERGVTIVVSVHQIDQARQFCDRVIGLRDGKVFCDCHRDQLTDEYIQQLYQRSKV